MAEPGDGAGRLVIRPMRAGDDIDAELDLRHRAFGPMGPAELAHWATEVRACIDDGRQFGVWSGGRLIGAARINDMRQWWRGRAQPMAGVAGVKVAPEARGLGVGRALMRALLDEIAARGYPLSVLYPATAHLYRSLGWEMAGGHYRIRVPGRSLGALLPPDPAVPASPDPAGLASGAAAGRPRLRRAGPADAEELVTVLGAVHAATLACGPCTWDVGSARRWLARPDLFAYLAGDGFVGYGWHRDDDDEINVRYLHAASPGTARALWGLVASHSSVTEVVHAAVGPADPISWLVREPDVALRRHRQWMLRVVDAGAAIAARGFPASARVSVPLLLADPDRPANAGPRTLTVADGAGTLVAGQLAPGALPIRLGPRGFAALFSGVPMGTLRAAGLAVGGDAAADEALDAAFGGRPYLIDYF